MHQLAERHRAEHQLAEHQHVDDTDAGTAGAAAAEAGSAGAAASTSSAGAAVSPTSPSQLPEEGAAPDAAGAEPADQPSDHTMAATGGDGKSRLVTCSIVVYIV